MNAFRINTNTTALGTMNSFASNQAGLETAIERLSSGLRINSAKDDAAGLSISTRMNNQGRGMKQANRNIQQGTNLVQTAEGGLDQIQNILGRMRELAVQSASDTMNANDRGSINLEFNQLKAEIARIADSTEYNGMKLLNGSKSVDSGNAEGISNIQDLITTGLSLPVGIEIYENKLYFSDDLTFNIRSSDLDGSNVQTLVSGLPNPYGMDVYEDKMYWVDPVAGTVSSANLDGTNMQNLVTGLSSARDIVVHDDKIYWTDSGTNKVQRSNLDGSNVEDLVTSTDGLSDPYGLTIHNNQVYWTDSGTDKIQRSNLDGSNVEDLVTTGLSNPKGITIHNDQIYWTDSGTNKIQRSNLDGSNVEDLATSTDGLSDPYGLTIHNNQVYWTDSGTNKIQRGDLPPKTTDLTLQVGANNTTNDQISLSIDSATTSNLSLSDTNLATLGDAQSAINALDTAIQRVNDQRSTLGATQNRLEFASSNLLNSVQNNSASMSTIRDADFAAEAANLAKSQILTQTGASMLAQANNLSQNILSLIR